MTKRKTGRIGTCYRDGKGRVVMPADFHDEVRVSWDELKSTIEKLPEELLKTTGVKAEATVGQGTGATRSDRTGKGRFDLLPPCVWEMTTGDTFGPAREALLHLAAPSRTDVILAVSQIVKACGGSGMALIRLAKRFEGGAAVHGERNWEKGVPVSRCLDALRRHLCQDLAGYTDEDHLGAALWNAIAMLHFWDTEHNDLEKGAKP